MPRSAPATRDRTSSVWGTIVRDRLTKWESYEPAPRPDDDVAVWTWLESNHTVGFVRRRQAHEALIHRLDAELTAGSRTEMDPTLATDGVCEALEWIHGGAPEWADVRRTGPIGRLATCDTGSAWLVEMATWSGTGPESGTEYRDEPAVFVVDEGAPSFEVIGSAADLDAWLWNRPTLGSITVEGDITALEAIVRSGAQ